VTADTHWNAFVPGEEFSIQEQAHGPLAGLTMSVKDLFDIAGHPTGAGNPNWRSSHAVPLQHAELVKTLLNAGARFVGKTITEELAYSLVGENVHYGTPVNPHNPDCIPGGSSSGAAAAAAAGLCDFSIGTDTAGSVRLPASFCGLWGFRPTHGVLSCQGVVPLAPSFDVPGWMAQSSAHFLRVGSVLLPPDEQGTEFGRLKLALPEDIWKLVHPGFEAALTPFIDRIARLFNGVLKDPVSQGRLIDWQDPFRLVQGHEAWSIHGSWIRSQKPHLGPGIKERFEWASTIDDEQAQLARAEMMKNVAVVNAYLEGAVICMPTVSYLAPQKGHASSAEDRTNALTLLCLASMAGLPQITMPLAVLEGKALGLSLMSRRFSDRQLLSLAQHTQGLQNSC
jgi:amidase